MCDISEQRRAEQWSREECWHCADKGRCQCWGEYTPWIEWDGRGRREIRQRCRALQRRCGWGSTSVSFDQRGFPAMSTLEWWSQLMEAETASGATGEVQAASKTDSKLRNLSWRKCWFTLHKNVSHSKSSDHWPNAIIPSSNKTGEGVNCRSEKVKLGVKSSPTATKGWGLAWGGGVKYSRPVRDYPPTRLYNKCCAWSKNRCFRNCVIIADAAVTSQKKRSATQNNSHVLAKKKLETARITFFSSTLCTLKLYETEDIWVCKRTMIRPLCQKCRRSQTFPCHISIYHQPRHFSN